MVSWDNVKVARIQILLLLLLRLLFRPFALTLSLSLKPVSFFLLYSSFLSFLLFFVHPPFFLCIELLIPARPPSLHLFSFSSFFSHSSTSTLAHLPERKRPWSINTHPQQSGMTTNTLTETTTSLAAAIIMKWPRTPKSSPPSRPTPPSTRTLPSPLSQNQSTIPLRRPGLVG